MRLASALLLLTSAAGCFVTPRTSFPDGGLSSAGRGGGAGGQSGVGGTSGVGATVGAGGTGGTGPVFVGGPCVVSPDGTSIEVFSRSSDAHIYRRAHDGSNWGSWTVLPALDGTTIDARSDLDCSASATSVHLVATGLSPVGALLHSFGSGTAYNPFFRELVTTTFGPSASIADTDDSRYTLGALVSGGGFPAVYEIGEASTPREITPIATETDSVRSAPDIAVQPSGGSKLTYFVSFDSTGLLAIYYNVLSSAGAHWADPVKLSPPTGTFSFSPTICTENGSFGVTSVNVAAVASAQLWFSRSSSSTSPFSPWTMVATDVASSPDCAIVGAESIVHIVTLSATGTVLDISGKETSWAVTDLGLPR